MVTFSLLCRYTKLVAKGMERAELIVKVLCIHTCLMLWVYGHSSDYVYSSVKDKTDIFHCTV